MRPVRSFGRRTPPAIFSVMLGLLGLALSWRAATRISVLPAGLADMVYGAAFAIYLFAFAAYAVKLMRRPGVILEDARILPGRAGLAAMAVSLSALTAGLVPLAPDLAARLLTAALALQGAIALLMVFTLATGPAEQRQVTPVWHLSFVGFIVAAVAAAALGRAALAEGILWLTMAVALFIYAVSAWQLKTRGLPAPLRPMLAIHLAPVSLFGIVSLGLTQSGAAELSWVSHGAGFLALMLMIALLANWRWIIEAGFSPLWASFTFPLSAFATFFLSYADAIGSKAALVIGGLAFVAASFMIPWIAAKALRLWMTGQLAAKTNAAEA